MTWCKPTNSVGKHIKGGEIAAEILMERSLKSSFLLVEGTADKKFFRRFTEIDCSITVCGGWENVIDAADSLIAAGFRRAIGVVDRDFSELVGYPKHVEIVLFTDHNDLEIMLLSSSALDTVLSQYEDDELRLKFDEKWKKSVRDVIFDASAFLGAFRVYSLRKRLNFRFDGMKYRFLNRTSFNLDKFKTVQHIFGRTNPVLKLSCQKIVQEVEEELTSITLSRDICCGHDCVRILGRALRHHLGNENSFDNENGAKQLEDILRIAFTWNDFRKTDLYKKIRDWEFKSGHKILRDPDSSDSD